MTDPAALALAALAVAGAAHADSPPTDPAFPPAAAFAAAGPDAAQDLLILGESRPVRVQIRTLVAGQTLRAASRAAAQTLRDRLDRDHDGKLTPDEAEAGGLALFGPTPTNQSGGNRPRAEADTDKDGNLSGDEVFQALGGAAGAFRVASDGKLDRRTDALFDHLDRDRDGMLTRPELDSLTGTLRRLDRDGDEWIALGEVAGNPGAAPPVAMGGMMAAGRAAPREGVPAVAAIQPDESPLRVVRLLIRKYDTTGRTPGRPDGRLGRDEFALPTAAFDALDTTHDQALSSDELRRYVAEGKPDAVVDVALPSDPASPARVALRAEDGNAPTIGPVRVLGDDLVELEVGTLRVDFQVDPGMSAREAARRRLQAQFQAADTTQDGYLDADEANPTDGPPAPFASLHRVLDRDGDGKVDRDDLDAFLDRQAEAARGRLTLSAADEGRALFGLLDPDGDRRLGAREVADTFRRVSACDRDRDGRVSPDEIPHQVHITLNQGELPPLGLTPNAPNLVIAANPVVVPIPRTTPRAHLGPDWFRRMDRNHDGDVSRREFLGSHAQFDRLDLDHDGLLGPGEADAASRSGTP